MPTDFEIIGRISTAQILDAMRSVTLGYAQEVAGILLTDKPPAAKRGTQVYKSQKQRRFVMANIANGNITFPYVRGRGNGLQGSQSLSQSYRTALDGDNAVLTSAASYAPYVVGDQQAPIHQGRWTTAMQAADRVKQDGTLQTILTKTMEGL